MTPKELLKIEAVCNYVRDDMDDVVQQQYEKACQAQDAELAAELARKIRDRLLSESDASMVLDRMGLELPDTITAATMLKALKDLISGLKNSVNGDMATYRQQLRDITEQEGFPFNVVFPEKPEN